MNVRELVLRSTMQIAEQSRWVSLHPEAIEKLTNSYRDRFNVPPREEKELQLLCDPDIFPSWLFVLEVLNHCFWSVPEKQRWEVSLNGKWYSGYWALVACLKRALKRGIPFHDARFLASLSKETLESIFAGRGKIPMLEERLTNLREAGKVLLSSWNADIVNLLENASGSALSVVSLLVEYFPSFRDEALYRGTKVYFYKRAQIFVADLFRTAPYHRWGYWKDVDQLTGFADYKLPQVLRQIGILRYHETLASKIDNYIFIEAGSEEEIEIRAATIKAVEKIRDRLQEQTGSVVSSYQIDQWLWALGQNDVFRKYPYHRTRTIYY